jgi:hypothetical protein
MSNKDNSAFGVYFKLSDDIKKLADNRKGKLQNEQRNNNGFMSFRECNQEGLRNLEIARIKREGFGDDKFYTSKDEYQKAIDAAEDAEYDTYDGSDEAEELCPITTPGTLISHSLEKAVGAGQDQLITADEFDEIIGALVVQLQKKIMGNSSNRIGTIYGGSGLKNIEDSDIEYTDPGTTNWVITTEQGQNDYISKLDPRKYDVAIKLEESSV